MSRDAAVVGAAQRFGWSSVDQPAARVALVAASVAVVTEASTYLLGSPAAVGVGGIPVSPSIVPLAIAGLAGGARGVGRARSNASRLTFWTLGIMALAVAATSLSSMRSPLAALALLGVGFLEEFMYRGAIPAVAAFALARLGVRPRVAGLAGLAIGGICFVILPGHVEQWSSPETTMPFVAFAVLSALAVWRTGALLEVALLHAVLNTVNIGRFDGASDPASALLLAALMCVLVVAYVPPTTRRSLTLDLTGETPDLRLGVPDQAKTSALIGPTAATTRF